MATPTLQLVTSVDQNPALDEFIKGCGETSADALLRVAAWVPGDLSAAPEFFFRGGATASYFRLNDEDKIRLEVAQWCSALERTFIPGAGVDTLQRLSPALYGLWTTHPPAEVQVVFARTWRMLRLLERMLLVEKSDPANAYVSGWSSEVNADCAALLARIRSGRYSIYKTQAGGWEISLTQLLVTAVAESQCEYFRPFAWEAYSAGRVRDELRRTWGGKAAPCADAVALFIRCQSAVGQLARGSGGDGFLGLLTDDQKFGFDSATMLAALRLLAIVEEARNHRTPDSLPIAHQTRSTLDVNIDSPLPWKSDEFAERVALYVSENISCAANKGDKSRPSPTFSYFGPQYIGLPRTATASADIAAFKETVLEVMRAQFPVVEFAGVSLGRTQTQTPLRDLMGAAISGWSTAEDRHSRFHRLFHLRDLHVPNPFGGDSNGHPEHTLQVLLRGDLAARQLLFRDVDIRAIQTDKTAHPDSAAGLYRFLFQEATAKMNLDQDSLWKGRPYAPIPLVARITDIVHQLRPDLCFNIPLTIGRMPPIWLHIPYGVAKDDQVHKEILATFILATVLNRAMGAGLTHAEVDLQNLAILPGTIFEARNQSQQDLALMGPEDWRKAVLDMYKTSGYDVLLGRYLRDYNTQKHTVHFDRHLSISGDSAMLPLGAVHSALVRYVAALSESDNARNTAEATDACGRDIVLFGVDIGGTLTKCQLFSYKYSTGTFSGGPIFRMSTAPPMATKPAPAEDTSIRARTENYAQRLLKLVESRVGNEIRSCNRPIVIIGLSWPGPVRDNHISGTSGCLKNFGPFSPVIIQNRIDDIWEVDLAEAVGKAWAKQFSAPPEFVSLLNDGDADAVGAVFGSRFGEGELESVVKLGTGLAGALLSSESGTLSLVPGLFEWGKFVIDVAAPPGRGFPSGVASTYLSKKCLPLLAALRGDRFGCFQRDDPDSAEIGLILQTFNSPDPIRDFGLLRSECGAIQAEKFPPWNAPVSAEVLRVVYRDPHSDPDLLYQVRLALRTFWDVEQTLRENIEAYGLTRIERLIKSEPPVNANAEQLRAILKTAAGVARGCAETLGRYLGDFCVLLYDQLGISALRLTGGVLTGDTGKIAKKSAEDRVKVYGFTLIESPDGSVYQLTRDGIGQSFQRNTSATVSPRLDTTAGVERGALGAAWFAAASLVSTRKQEGYQRLRALLLSLTAGEEVVLKETSIFAGEQKLDFAANALSSDELNTFLQLHGPEWGFYQSEENNKFVRWVQ